MVHRLLFGVSGQTLTHTPARRQAVTWVLEDLTVGEQEVDRVLGQGSIAAPFAGAITTRESGPSTGFSDRLFTPTSVEPGEMLRVTSSDTGVSELVTVAGAVSGQYLTTTHRLTTHYPAGSSVERLRVETASIPDEVVSDRERLQHHEPMRVVWTLVDDGERHQEQVYLVRASHGDIDVPRVLQTVRKLFPDIDTRFDNVHDLEGIVAVQAEGIQTKLRSLGMPTERFLAGDEGRFALAYRSLRHIAALGNSPGNVELTTWVDYLDREYEGVFADLTSGADTNETQHPEPIDDIQPAERPHRRRFQSI